MTERLIISTNVDLLRINSEHIVYILADGNYSTLVATDGGEYLITMQLGQVEKIIERQLTESGVNFIRIGKSIIINKQYITYINVPQQTLSDGHTKCHKQTASREALKQLKALIEQ